MFHCPSGIAPGARLGCRERGRIDEWCSRRGRLDQAQHRQHLAVALDGGGDQTRRAGQAHDRHGHHRHRDSPADRLQVRIGIRPFDDQRRNRAEQERQRFRSTALSSLPPKMICSISKQPAGLFGGFGQVLDVLAEMGKDVPPVTHFPYPGYLAG